MIYALQIDFEGDVYQILVELPEHPKLEEHIQIKEDDNTGDYDLHINQIIHRPHKPIILFLEEPVNPEVIDLIMETWTKL